MRFLQKIWIWDQIWPFFGPPKNPEMAEKCLKFIFLFYGSDLVKWLIWAKILENIIKKNKKTKKKLGFGTKFGQFRPILAQKIGVFGLKLLFSHFKILTGPKGLFWARIWINGIKIPPQNFNFEPNLANLGPQNRGFWPKIVFCSFQNSDWAKWIILG